MEDIIRIKDQYYVLATSPLTDDRTRVLKYGDTFAVFDRYGDIEPIGLGQHGIYHNETRFLSRLSFRLDNRRALLLNSAVKENCPLLGVDMTNLDVSVNGHVRVPRGTLHLFRAKMLWDGVCYDRVRVVNYGLQTLELWLAYQFDADFADIFEVRGMKRAHRGHRLESRVENGRAVLAYQGLDGVLRRTRIEFTPEPTYSSVGDFRLHAKLGPREEISLCLTVACEDGNEQISVLPFKEALQKTSQAAQEHPETLISTSRKRFAEWVTRSSADLHLMITGNPEGAYPYAGVPWFNTVFGRDGIITAMECLWWAPWMARGVLKYLSATQATKVNAEQDAEPGKILHETRRGEMANLKEVPFGCYYGSVDATPLYVMLAGAYYERTADLEFVTRIWPNIEKALGWMDSYGDADHDGFVEYSRRSPTGLVQQGWKDSSDSIFHADGQLAEPPIALCEVQAYVFAAKKSAALLAEALGKPEVAARLNGQADELQQKFEKAFWCEEISSYALALDGQKRPCQVRSSNAGHCLFAGIASAEHAEVTARTLLGQEMFSGWGVRTIGIRESRYNPMSYHNGSIWPHDNAIVAKGLARYGFGDLAVKILNALYDASLYMDLHRLPELFCGFGRHAGDGPTLYPVACSPQSWASAAVFSLLESCLGLSVNALKKQIIFNGSRLPEVLRDLNVQGLKVNGSSVNLTIERQDRDLGIIVTQREGDVEVLALK